MALVYTPPAEKNKTFSHFQLPTVEGRIFQSRDIPNHQAVVLMFICNHCPYVKAVEDRLIRLALDFKNDPICFLAICSNDPTDYPEDRPEQLLTRSKEKNYPFVYLVDADQTVARSFGAVCTPDFFVFSKETPDSARNLFYRGRLDDSWKDPNRVTRQELAEALKTLLHDSPAPQTQIPSMGCSIKWKEEPREG